jgi:hypothetical protein
VTSATILVVQLASEDWVVRGNSGRELGHYPSRDAAAAVGRRLARKDQAELIIFDLSGETQTEWPAKGWSENIFGR